MISFAPGFRISGFDIAVLSISAVASIILAAFVWWAGLVLAFVIIHFFLFCNVFRISRSPELTWAASFALLATATILTGWPGRICTIAVGVLLGSFLIWRETGKAHYHGICWEKWNPGLLECWDGEQSGDGSA